ncbi:MAG TPA: hypothetical protein VFY78_08935 [Gammaproteobacteria bacterium]|nr:hypothetical protein [Gammaproteobacteria bacterium]
MSTLRTQLHVYRIVWRRCSSLQGMALPRHRALPVNPVNAHLGAFN